MCPLLRDYVQIVVDLQRRQAERIAALLVVHGRKGHDAMLLSRNLAEKVLGSLELHVEQLAFFAGKPTPSDAAAGGAANASAGPAATALLRSLHGALGDIIGAYIVVHVAALSSSHERLASVSQRHLALLHSLADEVARTLPAVIIADLAVCDQNFSRRVLRPATEHIVNTLGV